MFALQTVYLPTIRNECFLGKMITNLLLGVKAIFIQSPNEASEIFIFQNNENYRLN